MKVDRARFLAWVTTLAAGACSPGPKVATPESPTTSSSVATPIDSAAPTTSASPTARPTATTAVDRLAGCDAWAFGPCGEGGYLHDTCRSVGFDVDAPDTAKYFGCLDASLPPTFAKAGPSCDEAARKCGKAIAGCDALAQQETACRKKVNATCAASKEVTVQQTCWEQCLEKGAKPPPHACAKKCGEFEGAQTMCVEVERKKQCQPLREKADACLASSHDACKAAAACNKALGGACGAASEALGACAEKAKKP
ncbi:MAG: hypothetical protein IPJ34_05360 [Myxococcales bacterium]|nr:hypothetical protein [Myxococcales bacterium]